MLWNNQQVINLLMGHSCVKAWFNGHNHAGAYTTHDGIHFLTFKGMVDTDETSYGMAELGEKKILVTGFGRESDRVLELK